MARTKPTEAQSKIRRDEEGRLRELKANSGDFQRDLARLEALAKRLQGTAARLIPAAEPSNTSDRDLIPTVDEAFRAEAQAFPAKWDFRAEAQAFTAKWDFRPRYTNDGRLLLFIRSPVTITTSLETGDIIETTHRLGHHTASDVSALQSYYIQMQELVRAEKGKSAKQKRKRPDTAEEKVVAKALKAQGKTLRQIAEVLFPREFKAALDPDKKSREQLGGLIAKYRNPPHNMTVSDAQRKAAKELGIDLRPLSIRLQKLTHRVRNYLKSKSLDK